MCSHSAAVEQPLPVTTIRKGKACEAKRRSKGEKEEERGGERADEGEKEGRKEVGERKEGRY